MLTPKAQADDSGIALRPVPAARQKSGADERNGLTLHQADALQ
jgi:hypothetical protein